MHHTNAQEYRTSLLRQKIVQMWRENDEVYSSHMQYGRYSDSIHWKKHVTTQKTCDYIFYNNVNYMCPITIIFGKVSSQCRRHRKMVSFPTSPI